MNSPNRPSERHFHELPLVLFSALGISGAGVGSAHLIRVGSGSSPFSFSAMEGMLLTVLLLLGLISSVGHLGKPLRGPLALRGVGRSPLSNEVLALGLALGAGSAGLFLRWVFPPAEPLGSGTLPAFLGLLASLASVAFLLAVGLLYNLPGRLTWQGPVVVHPLVLGTAWGLLCGMDRIQMPGQLALISLLTAVLVVDGLLQALRVSSRFRAQRTGEAVYPRFLPWGLWLMFVRFVLSTVLAPLALLGGLWWLAVLGFFLAIFLDRAGFYLLAMVQTTESEVARVESLL